jgi:hypothetical protein
MPIIPYYKYHFTLRIELIAYLFAKMSVFQLNINASSKRKVSSFWYMLSPQCIILANCPWVNIEGQCVPV